MPDDSNVRFLPGAEDRQPVEQVLDVIVARAVAKGWTVERRSTTYAVITRPRASAPGHKVQITAAMINGTLKASRVVVLEDASTANTVLDWLES